jgi:filamentous hemagglutinin family protein
MNLLIIPSPRRRFTSVAACFWAYGMFVCVSLPFALAGPENPQVVNGDVSIQQSGYNTTITASDKAIINYSSFDIARPETVQFIQPGSSASVLNRILSATPTTIDGTLLANGCVFFVNPAGVYFGEGAQVNVNQLVASALNISDSDFMNGRYDFVSGDGAVVNSGNISAEKVFLIGQEVMNSGNINCPGGYVVMAAGDRVFLAEPGSDVVVEVGGPDRSEPAGATDSTPAVPNEGTDNTTGGIKALAGAGDLYSYAISNVGTLSASVETGSAGRIVLAAGGEVTNTGTIEATGDEGGQVTMEGARVGQFGTIHADGIESHGGDVSLRASQVVALSSDSLTTANAGRNGNGGEVTVFSPDTALFWSGARIEARGGAASGNGGFVEVSGKQHVEIYGLVDTAAPKGEVGTFLIDPFDIEIGDWTPDGTQNGSWSGLDPQVWTAAAASGSRLDVDNLLSYLDDANVEVMTGGNNADITVAAAIDYSDAMYYDLTLTASGNIIIQQPITTGTHDLTLSADSDTSGGGNVSVGAAINLAAGNFTSSGVDFDNTGGAITTNGGSVDLSGHSGSVTIGSALDATGGGGTGTVNIADPSIITARADVMAGSGIVLGSAVTADGTGNQTFDAGSGILSATGTITKTTAGNLTLGGAAGVNLGGTVEVQNGALAIEDAFTGQGDITASGDVTLAAATLDGADQRIDAVGGTLSASGAITKTTAGNLALGGDGGIDLGGVVQVQSGALAIEDAFTGQGDITASGDVTLGGAATLEGGDQRIDAVGGTLSAGDTITKTIAGSLTLGGAAGIDLGGTVEVQDGTLAIEDPFTGQGNITAGSDVTLGGAATLEGGDQRIDAVGGMLAAGDTITKTTAGSLALGGAAGIDLGGTVEVQDGALAVEDAFTGQGDVTASGDVTLAAGATLDGADQRMDAIGGTLSAAGAITKTTAGSLVLGGGTGIDLGGTVEVQSGALQIEDAFTGQGNITASSDVTLNSAATLEGGNQRIDAVGGTLSAGDTITKTTAGNLALGGAAGIDLGGTVEVQSGALAIEDAFTGQGDITASSNVTLGSVATLDGGDQRVDAVGGVLSAVGAITKSTAGSLVLGGAGGIDLGGTVEVQNGALQIEDAFTGQGNITASSDVTLNSAATLDGGNQRIDAVGGTLSAGDTITKTTVGSLVLGGATGIDLDGTVEVQSGALAIEDAFTGQGDITASGSVTLAAAATLDGADQRMDAVGGALSAAGAVVKTTAGSLALGGAAGINLGDTVEVQNGSLTLEDNTVVATDGSVRASHNVVLAAGRTLTGTGSLLVEATAGQISAAGVGSVITVSGSSLTLRQLLDLDLADFSFGNQANTDLVLQSSGGSVTVVDTAHGGKNENAADRWKSITADAHGQIALQGWGKVVTGALESATGNIEVLSTGGDLIINGPVNADGDLLDSTGGGVSLTADAGRIYTDDGSGTLNVPLTGYSDAGAGAGVDLPFSPGFRAAIVIRSKDALVLGPQATLRAHGTYYADVDDRPGVGFLTSGDGAGDLIDVAIYLGSPSTLELFNVDVRSKVDFLADYGGMVIDGGDAVTFKNTGSLFLTSGAFDLTNRLEVVSRSSITKEELVLGRPADQPKLPYAQNPEGIRTDWPLFTSAYVLRGELGLIGNARQLDWTEPVPLAFPKPLELEESGDVEGPDVESLVTLLSELGIGVQPYLADAYAGSLSTDLRLLKAAERLQGLIAILEDAGGRRTAALRVVVGRSFPTLDSISEEQVDSFRRELAGHAGDGTDHDLAGQTLSALTTYVDILSTDVGWPMDRSVGFVMGRYVPRLTEGDDIRTAVVQMQLEQASGT